MEIRIAQREDLPQLKHIWKLCFGDEDSHIDFYFANRNWTEENAVLLSDGEIVSMLSMIPVEVVRSGGERFGASMLYAIATHPEYQKQGIAGRLMDFAGQYLLDKGVGATMLVPAGEELFRFYEHKGYQTEYRLREAVLSRAELEKMRGREARQESRGNVMAASIGKAPKVGSEPLCLIPAEPAAYNEVRRRLLKGHTYVDYRDEEIAFQKKECQLYQADIYLIKNKDDVSAADDKDALGCAVIERISEEKIAVKELLVPEQYVRAAAKSIADMMQAETYIFRTPSLSGNELEGSVRPFGMLRFQEASGRCCMTGMDAYLGIAYD